GHVIPSLIRKFYEAKAKGDKVQVWGDGTAARDFLYSKDMARALVFAMQQCSGPINVASGIKTYIRQVVETLASYFEMGDKVEWQPQMPNGRTYYEVDLTRLKSLGFVPQYSIQSGLKETLDWFVESYEQNLVRV